MKYHGKFESPRKSRRMTMVAALALALVLTVSAGGTLAWLFTSTDPVENTFSPAEMGIVVRETFENNTKTNVYVENTRQADVYIRAAIVVNWQDDNGNVVAEPVSENDYTMTLGTGWTKNELDGYYYCTTANQRERNKTSHLIEYCAPNGTPKYHLSVSVLAQAIQAEPNDAVKDAWGENLPGLAVINAGSN